MTLWEVSWMIGMHKKVLIWMALSLAFDGCMLKEVEQYGDICENNAKVNYIIYSGKASCNVLDGGSKCSEEDIALGMEGKCPQYTHCYKDKDDKHYCMTECSQGKVACDGDCIDPKSDPKFCGADDSCHGFISCERGCEDGKCVQDCPSGQVLCNEKCIDPSTSKDYCGADELCSSYERCAHGCIDGKCSDTCSPGMVLCGNECINPLDSNRYCGADSLCEHYEDCGSQSCINGECRLVCPEGQVKCDEHCIDPLNDKDYCGADKNCMNYENNCLFCNEGSCVKECEEKKKYCQDNQIMECNGAYTKMIEKCDDGYYCSVSGDSPECKPKECDNEGELICSDDKKSILSCHEYHKVLDSECVDYQHCEDGTCVYDACSESGEIRCVDDSQGTGYRLQCESGRWAIIDKCEDEHSCNNSSCGECHNDDEKCVESSAFACKNGQWVEGECSYSCTKDGKCGECKEGEERCRVVGGTGMKHICKDGEFNNTGTTCNSACSSGQMYYDPSGECLAKCSSYPQKHIVGDICVNHFTSMDHCGGENIKCSINSVPNSLKVNCENMKCVATACKQGYTLNSSTKLCDLKDCKDPTCQACNDDKTVCLDDTTTNVGAIYSCVKGNYKQISACSTSCDRDNLCGECINGQYGCKDGKVVQCTQGKYNIISQSCVDIDNIGYLVSCDGNTFVQNKCSNNYVCDSTGNSCGNCTPLSDSCNSTTNELTFCDKGNKIVMQCPYECRGTTACKCEEDMVCTKTDNEIVNYMYTCSDGIIKKTGRAYPCPSGCSADSKTCK